ncbi:unnamed protein product [Phytophthora fragariaefolia]|uniref:Unnamed protein product n=1 Tax=Phytophthora fragariaefolia TaxID=1490495 RepID=A0A9W7CQL2_9STRA|nr:unnamed protein product [Phytophthora fragariaefolia]
MPRKQFRFVLTSSSLSKEICLVSHNECFSKTDPQTTKQSKSRPLRGSTSICQLYRLIFTPLIAKTSTDNTKSSSKIYRTREEMVVDAWCVVEIFDDGSNPNTVWEISGYQEVIPTP